jgi:hypothetical protein
MTDTLAIAGHAVARMPMGTTCAVHKHRSYVPMERHHVWPLGMGGPNIAANLITVCCNGHYEIHEYLRQLILHGQAPANWRHFSPKVRAYALSGWEQAGKPSSGGGE